MHFLLNDKIITKGVGDGNYERVVSHDIYDQMQISQEIYSADNTEYYVYETIHEPSSKDKLIINGKDIIAIFHGNCSKFRVF